MTSTNETVHDRFETVQIELTAGEIAAGLALLAALTFALMFLQDPLAHDSLHTFRHAAGITCH
ncbi:CbtB domain-containing protein [Halomarina halobia]|uniref:CbtB domain-containing protein n=1 Tax=Halomarina halobia TaxID=3033386 RepID=A0ABD6A3R1_9EURY|nr:CbtB domain-containing protein [Halomarina sp. PSR21]